MDFFYRVKTTNDGRGQCFVDESSGYCWYVPTPHTNPIYLPMYLLLFFNLLTVSPSCHPQYLHPLLTPPLLSKGASNNCASIAGFYCDIEANVMRA